VSTPPEDREGEGGKDSLVGIAWAKDRYEAAMIKGLLGSAGIPCFTQRAGIDGPLVGSGVINPGGGGLRVIVPASRAEEAQAALAEVLAEDAAEIPEPVNAAYLAEARGHKPRGYGLFGAYARIYAFAFAFFALAFAVFLLVRAL
jgi:hypothetical protein